MQLRRMAALLAGIAVAAGFMAANLTAAETQQTKEGIWQDEPREARHAWWERGPTDDVIEKIMKGLEKRDPAKAKELTRLRDKDPERFKAELREAGRPEIEQMVRDHWEARRQKRNADFVEWLKANYPQEEQSLSKLKEGDPQVYIKNFDHLMNQYGYIFDAENSNPELGTVLKEDLRLRKRGDELYRQLRKERSEAKKQQLGTELQEVVALRYDLIVRRKEIAYEQLLRRLDELQKQVRESKDEITNYKDARVKQENVRQRVQALTENKVRFKWD
jgi:hypothetical protein